MEIRSVLADFDGKHVADLKSAAARVRPGDVPDLVACCLSHDAATATGATWIAKAVLERGLTAPRLAGIFAVLDRPEHWEAALHVLQSVRYMPEAVSSDQITPFLGHGRVLLRVWALDALVHAGLAQGANRDDLRKAVGRALTDGSAAMRARARDLRKFMNRGV